MSNITIHRCPHDQKNPYVMINNNLIRDASLSPECRWLLIYLLSNEEGWKISVKQLRTHLKGFCGKNKIYDLLNEAVNAGYMHLEEFLVNNLKRTQYVVSETPKFKKSFPRPDFRDPEIRDTENREPESLYNKKDHKDKNNQKKEDMSEPAAGRVTSYFYEGLKKVNPKVKKPNLDKWAKEFELLAKDGNSEQDIIKTIDFVFSTHGKPSSNGFCWANVILSPTSLRNNFAKLWAQMGCGTQTLRANPDENKKFAEKLQTQFENRTDMVFGYNYIEFVNGMRSNKYEFMTKDFQEKCLHELRTRKLIKDSA